MSGDEDWQRDRSVRIFLDPPPGYGENAVFMLVRVEEANISGDCWFTEFYLEGFGRLSHCSPASDSDSALHLHFSDVWACMPVQSPDKLWTQAELVGLHQTGRYRIRSDRNERQACSRLCHELFGTRPAENSGKMVTEKFVPWVARMFDAASPVDAASARSGPSSPVVKPVVRPEATVISDDEETSGDDTGS
jgi:hypothetical protein